MCVDSSNEEADERTVAYYSKETVPRKTVVTTLNVTESRKFKQTMIQ